MRPVKLRFTAEAREHIAAIYSYIQDRNPVAATQVVARIRLAAEQLAEFPRLGHLGRVPDTHEWLCAACPILLSIKPKRPILTRCWYSAYFMQPKTENGTEAAITGAP